MKQVLASFVPRGKKSPIRRFFDRIILMKKKFPLIIFLSAILFLISMAILFSSYFGNQNLVCFKNNCFAVEIAETNLERSHGLMFREKLDLDKGMLFVFEEEGEHSFWMKNTLIPLDIIWINKAKEVVFISGNSQPCQEEYACPSINPGKNAKYVLEINAGVAEKIGLKVGDKICFSKIEARKNACLYPPF